MTSLSSRDTHTSFRPQRFVDPEAALLATTPLTALSSRKDEHVLRFEQLEEIRTALKRLSLDPTAWYLMVVHCEPVIVRLLLQYDKLGLEQRAHRVMLHRFYSPESRNELPWLQEAFHLEPSPLIPWHRHNWASSSYSLEGTIWSTGGRGTLHEPPTLGETTYHESQPRRWDTVTAPDFWHQQGLLTPTASKIFIAHRKTFRDYPLPEFRPQVSLIENSVAKADQLEHFAKLLHDN